MQRSTGVSIIAILVIIGGLIGVLAGLFDLGLFGTATFYGGEQFLSAAMFGAGLLIVAIIQLVVGFGLWNLKGWAWTIAMIVLVIRVIGDVIALFAGGNLMAVIINLLITVIVIWYLNQGEIKEAFGK